MGTIKKLKIEESIIKSLREIIKEDSRYRVRKRANAILYKSQEYSVKEIAKILEVRADTVYKWICKYKVAGVESLYDKQGRGRKMILKDSDADKIKTLVLNCPSIPVANAKVRETLKIFVHDNTLKNYLKKTHIELHTSKESTTKRA
jgi:transposase